MAFDMVRFVNDTFRAGVNHIIDGARGLGKTHFGVSVSQRTIEGEYGDREIIALTNIVFVQKTADGLKIGHPDKVRHVTTMADMMRQTGEILREYGIGNVTIMLLLDEAQNFMLADLNSAAENLAMVKYMANTRKFGHCTVFMTPTYRNLVPKIRNFADATEPGYCGVLWRKDRRFAMEYLRRNPGLKLSVRDITSMKMGDQDAPVPMHIPSTSWCTPPEKLKMGEYAYDTLSAADFSLGEGFNIKEFLKRCSGVPSFGIPDAIDGYFASVLETEQENEENGAMTQIRRIDVLRRHNIPWKIIAEVEGMSESGIRSRWERNAQKSYKSSQNARCARDGFSSRAYIEPYYGGPRGDFLPRAVEESE